MKKRNIKYCRECGSRLFSSTIDADKIKVWYPDSMGGTMFILDSPFNEKTGEKNIAELLECPNKKRFFNNHDKIVIYDGDTHWL